MSIIYSGIKMATGLTAEFGVSIMTAELANKLIPEGAGKATKICCTIGAAGLSGVAGNAAHKYWNNFYDSLAEIPKDIKELRETHKELKKKEKELKEKLQKEEEK